MNLMWHVFAFLTLFEVNHSFGQGELDYSSIKRTIIFTTQLTWNSLPNEHIKLLLFFNSFFLSDTFTSYSGPLVPVFWIYDDF